VEQDLVALWEAANSGVGKDHSADVRPCQVACVLASRRSDRPRLTVLRVSGWRTAVSTIAASVMGAACVMPGDADGYTASLAVRSSWSFLMRHTGPGCREAALETSHWRSGTNFPAKLVLGTAQLGMQYGIANRTGRPARSLAIEIIRRAMQGGVTVIDTARAYGDAEQIIGEAFADEDRERVQVITKLDPLSSLLSTSSSKPQMAELRKAVDESIRRSCESLRVTTLATLLLHRWEHHDLFGGAVWQRLLELVDEQKIGALGASVYTPEEARAALQDPAILHLQIPLNVIDWRWRAEGIDRLVAARPDVVVHARSALLQGVLGSEPELWPVSRGYAVDCLQMLRDFAKRFDRDSVIDLCFAYVRAQAWITGIAVGCETLEQLENNLRLFGLPPLTEQQCQELEQRLPRAPEQLLIPSRWNDRHEQRAS
jgi:aryl-alcohol dehydrogenase-like predicted oxidoreductase